MDVKSVIETIVRDSLILVFNEDKLDIVKNRAGPAKSGC